MNIFKRKRYTPKIQVGDLVKGDSDEPESFAEYFRCGPREVVNVRPVNGPEGDAVSLKGLHGVELWSKYLVKVSPKLIDRSRPVVDPPSPTQTRGSGAPLDYSMFWNTILVIVVSSIVSIITTIVLHNISK